MTSEETRRDRSGFIFIKSLSVFEVIANRFGRAKRRDDMKEARWNGPCPFHERVSFVKNFS
jgi:hypothetical protein